MDLLIRNIGCIVTGSLDSPLEDADSILISNGVIKAIYKEGSEGDHDTADVATVVDARGCTVAPGLIDSHVHLVLGGYAPKQKSVDFLDQYLEGGTTTVLSAGEIHAPAIPEDRAGVKALALASHATARRWRPRGMRVHAGSLIIQPSLIPEDFAELRAEGMWLAKAGLGAFKEARDSASLVKAAQAHGFKVMLHCGGASPAFPKPITAEDIEAINPDVCGHINGGTTALPDDQARYIVDSTDLSLQIVQAGNLRSAVMIAERCTMRDELHRLLIATDTPTGTGVMPLGMLKTVAEIGSFTDIPAAQVLALATGNPARTFGLNTGVLADGKPADLIIIDAPLGSAARNALEAIRLGDIPGICAVIVDGVIRCETSQYTPPPSNKVVIQRHG